MIKTFRGILSSLAESRIRLSTKKGKIGYRVVKFQIMTEDPFNAGTVEHVMKIYKLSQTTINDSVDFSDGNLLGVATWHETDDLDESGYGDIIFDQEIFNQDVFITHSEVFGSKRCNYYLELEVMPLTDNAAAVSTLRDIRTTENTP